MFHIDEIYELFSWDWGRSEEENREREERGLRMAKGVKNLFPFMQPLIPGGKSKSVWEPCAKVIAARSDGELEPYLYLMLEWLRDMNWPGTEIIMRRLSEMPYEMLLPGLLYSKDEALRENATLWLSALESLENMFPEKK